ncbi:hypothetical protein [Egicoccus halophilus]|uniref:ATP/GTP-binding protein n=1 Tax=Egicoccus halophilus TaxID=1670830 RepID=A0A8J3ET02_9ACTN|nr:hypothetical protein [Egicoccus halophilus]GGI04184.1 hypothetical protein GCM10011354_07800 [Egicoccus halophilus]
MGLPPRPDPFLPVLAGYEVQRVPAFRATKDYVCPDCGNTIRRGEGHVVAWPEGLVVDRRHWHLHCWRLASNRGYA